MCLDNQPEKPALIFLYQNVHNDIEFLKRQQWTISYYVILIYAASISAFKMICVDILFRCAVASILGVILVVACLVALKILCDCDKSLEKYRELIDDVECRLKLTCIAKKHQTGGDKYFISKCMAGAHIIALIIGLFALYHIARCPA